MNAQATRRGVPAVALWGGLGALAWAALTVLTGGSSAHADDETPLLDGVSSLVSETVSTVEDTVTAVTKPVVTVTKPVVTQVAKPVVTEVVKPVVTEVVKPVVTQVVKPVQQSAPAVVEQVSEAVTQIPVAGPVTAPVVTAVTDTATAVVTPVTDLLKNAPASQIIDPVQRALSELPVVGRLLDDLGVNLLVDEVVDVVDTTTDIVGGVVDETVIPVAPTLDPNRPGGVTPAQSADPTDSNSAAVAIATAPARSAAPGSAAFTSEPLVTSVIPAASAPASDRHDAPTAPPVGSPAAPTSSAGSGGASALSHARLSDVGVPALRAVERTPGASDDVLPTSLVADTDVSPD